MFPLIFLQTIKRYNSVSCTLKYSYVQSYMFVFNISTFYTVKSPDMNLYIIYKYTIDVSNVNRIPRIFRDIKDTIIIYRIFMKTVCANYCYSLFCLDFKNKNNNYQINNLFSLRCVYNY